MSSINYVTGLMQPRMTSLLCLKRSLALRSSTFNSERFWQQTFFSSTYFKCFQIPSSGLTGSLLSLVESHALMVVEVFRYDQTLPCKPGSWTA
jgi:hypothetical protein